jgi:hypothetical protein
MNRAVEVIDGLMAQWYSAKDRFPKFPCVGRSEVHGDLAWEARPTEQRIIGSDNGFWIVRVGVFAIQEPSTELTYCDILVSESELAIND